MKRPLRGRVLVYIAILLAIIGFTAPELYTPGTFNAKGPGNVYSPTGTSYLNYYATDPIPRGQTIQVTLSSSKPGSTILSICVLSTGTICNSDFSKYNFQTQPNTTSLTEEITAPTTAQYLISVSSLNESQFTLTVSSVWAPYYDLRLLVYFAIPTVIIGLVLWYYDRWRFKQYEIQQEAIRSTAETMMLYCQHIKQEIFGNEHSARYD